MSEVAVSRPGPKTELTPHLQEVIRGYVNAGASLPTAATAAGVNPETAKKWMARGRKGHEPYATFAREIDKARAMHRVAMQMVITGAAKRGEWKAAAFDITRREQQARARDAQAQRFDPLADDERVVLLYPVPMPEGARLEDLQLAEGHAIDTTGEPVEPGQAITVAYEDTDHDD